MIIVNNPSFHKLNLPHYFTIFQPLKSISPNLNHTLSLIKIHKYRFFKVYVSEQCLATLSLKQK